MKNNQYKNSNFKKPSFKNYASTSQFFTRQSNLAKNIFKYVGFGKKEQILE